MASDNRERDITLSPNEYILILDKTKGAIRCIVGSCTINLSANEVPVIFDEKKKRFVEVSVDEATKTFVTVPEGWYTALKNPEEKNLHPVCSTSNQAPELKIGRKVNIKGPCSFALWPGQMAKVIKGHSLHTNQYVLVRAYENNNDSSIGQLSIVKGTDKAFYIPDTGYEVVPLPDGKYVRDAVTLENIQYCILKNEAGEYQYVHGPAVVFPEPDQVFVLNKENSSYKFDGIRLSETSGIYVKNTQDFVDGESVIDHQEKSEDEDGNEVITTVYKDPVLHKAGEEEFITGKDVAIYYPRPEQEIIEYDGQKIHFAIAIPKGEGRYVLNRLTGEIRMVTGPTMFLPDPRFEVIVQRTLTQKQCEMWYPNNEEVLAYNGHSITALKIDDSDMKILRNDFSWNNLNNTQLTMSSYVAPTQGTGNIDSTTKMGINRRNTYTPPRTISLDSSKYAGVVTIDVWAGYAVSVVSKDGNRRVEIGPKTVLLGYDETLEVVGDDTVYLQINDNLADFRVRVQTKDYVDFDVDIDCTYNLNTSQKDQWFGSKCFDSILTDSFVIALTKAVKKLTMQEWLDSYVSVVDTVADGLNKAKLIMSIGNTIVQEPKAVNKDVAEMIEENRKRATKKAVELFALRDEVVATAEVNKLQHQIAEGNATEEAFRAKLEQDKQLAEIKDRKDRDTATAEAEKAKLEAEKKQENIRSENEKIRLQREKDKTMQEITLLKERNAAEIERINAETEARKKLLDSISPNLVEAITVASKHETLREISENLSPYMLAGQGESIADMINKLCRGTSLEGIIDKALATK